MAFWRAIAASIIVGIPVSFASNIVDGVVSALLNGSTAASLIVAFAVGVLVGAPFVERLTRVAAIQAALGSIAAAVVGVMANFAIGFAWQAIFPDGRMNHPDVFVLVVTIGALAVLMRWKIDVMWLIGGCAALGVIYRLLLPG